MFSSELTSSQQSGHSIYKPSSSATKLSGSTWSISYGDGSSASGDVYKDTVTVGGVKATGQAVEAASKISSSFQQDVNNDGLLGLAFSSINTVSPNAQTTFFDTVKSQLDSPLFAVTLKHNAPGSYDFGYIDKSKYTGTLAYADVDDSQGFWSFTADSYKIGTTAGGSITGIAGKSSFHLIPIAFISITNIQPRHRHHPPPAPHQRCLRLLQESLRLPEQQHLRWLRLPLFRHTARLHGDHQWLQCRCPR